MANVKSSVSGLKVHSATKDALRILRIITGGNDLLLNLTGGII